MKKFVWSAIILVAIAIIAVILTNKFDKSQKYVTKDETGYTIPPGVVAIEDWNSLLHLTKFSDEDGSGMCERSLNIKRQWMQTCPKPGNASINKEDMIEVENILAKYIAGSSQAIANNSQNFVTKTSEEYLIPKGVIKVDDLNALLAFTNFNLGNGGDDGGPCNKGYDMRQHWTTQCPKSKDQLGDIRTIEDGIKVEAILNKYLASNKARR